MKELQGKKIEFRLKLERKRLKNFKLQEKNKRERKKRCCKNKQELKKLNSNKFYENRKK